MAKNEFTLDVAKFAAQFEDGAEQAIRGTTIKLWSGVIAGTPVDGGRTRGNWFATGAAPSSRINYSAKDLSNDGEATAKRAEKVVLGLKDWSTFTLTNNYPSAVTLEYGGYPDPVKKGTYNKRTKTYEKRSKSGYSKQAPNGMVRVNIARFNRLLELEARKRLPK